MFLILTTLVNHTVTYYITRQYIILGSRIIEYTTVYHNIVLYNMTYVTTHSYIQVWHVGCALLYSVLFCSAQLAYTLLYFAKLCLIRFRSALLWCLLSIPMFFSALLCSSLLGSGQLCSALLWSALLSSARLWSALLRSALLCLCSA